MRKRKTIKNDWRGGIEGLPLQLMIMVVIAGIGTTVILGWMSGLQPPSTIASIHTYPGEIVLTDSDGDGIFQAGDITIQITVLDTGGNGISGATVLLEGASICYQSTDGTVHGVTDSAGKLILSGLKASLAGEQMGFITVTVIKSGYGSEGGVQVPVICE